MSIKFKHKLEDPLQDARYKIDVMSMELASLRDVCKQLGDELRECHKRIEENEALIEEGAQ